MTNLFDAVTSGVIAGLGKDTKQRQVVVSMGDLTLPYAMADVSAGDQSSRFQIDMALDGTIHVVGAVNGIGSFKMQFMDCPLYLETAESDDNLKGALSTFLQSETIKKRIVTVSLYGIGDVCENGKLKKPSSAPIARFSGIATQALVTVTPPDKNQLIYLRTQINATGSWSYGA